VNETIIKALKAAKEVVDGVPTWHNAGYAAKLIDAALAQAPQPAQMPEGYVLVPVEPTEAMRVAFFKAMRGNCHPDHPVIGYKAMIAAAPAAPDTSQKEDGNG